MTRWGIAAVVLVAGALLAGCGGGSPSAAGPPSTTQVVQSLSASLAPAQAGPTAETVVDHFQLAGLPAAHPRDNSANCPQFGCTQMITTDAVTVVTFADQGAATKYAQTWGADAHQQGLIVLSYLAARTPAADRPKYEAALAKLAG
jgi:hypothetical protein